MLEPMDGKEYMNNLFNSMASWSDGASALRQERLDRELERSTKELEKSFNQPILGKRCSICNSSPGFGDNLIGGVCCTCSIKRQEKLNRQYRAATVSLIKLPEFTPFPKEKKYD